jgi:hypothetical protein
MGGFEVYPKRKYKYKVRRSWRRVICIHNLSNAMTEEVEQIVREWHIIGMTLTRVDVRWDFVFANRSDQWKWMCSYDATLWIKGSRKVKRRYWWTDEYNAYVARCAKFGKRIEYEPEYNGNYSLKEFPDGKKPSNNLTVYFDPANLDGLPYLLPTARLERSIAGSSAAVQRVFKDSVADTVYGGNPEELLRRLVCLRIAGAIQPIPQLPVPVEPEVDARSCNVKLQQLHSLYKRQ